MTNNKNIFVTIMSISIQVFTKPLPKYFLAFDTYEFHINKGFFNQIISKSFSSLNSDWQTSPPWAAIYFENAFEVYSEPGGKNLVFQNKSLQPSIFPQNTGRYWEN